MVLRTKIEPIDDWISITVDEMLSPEARQEAVASFARAQLAETLEGNRLVLGRPTPYQQFVDGRQGAPLNSVNPDRGRIIFEFELFVEILSWIYSKLVERSPRGPKGGAGTYRDAHRLFADDKEIAVAADVPQAAEYAFANLLPYARRLEIGKTEAGRDFLVSVPNRIYERTAKDARSRFGNIAKIGFSYRGYVGGGVVRGRPGNKANLRYPTITVRPL
ncbi:hypothetical protein [Mesorhizobium sp. KR9-304]|uniref:hypothetical protein n=1 Tax=Mesorhizobium sp. KR9-304 TaxID=3156614 RepID=UPI0032B58E50